MCGRSRHADDLYYGCQSVGAAPEGHPKSLWVSEPKLVAGVYAFFAKYVPQAPALLDAFRLVIRYDRPANVAQCQVTVGAGTKIDPVTFCVVPPVGVEPTL